MTVYIVNAGRVRRKGYLIEVTTEVTQHKGWFHKLRLAIAATVPYTNIDVPDPVRPNVVRLSSTRPLGDTFGKLDATHFNTRLNALEGSLLVPGGIDWAPENRPMQVLVGLMGFGLSPLLDTLVSGLRREFPSVVTHGSLLDDSVHDGRVISLLVPGRDTLKDLTKAKVKTSITEMLSLPF